MAKSRTIFVLFFVLLAGLYFILYSATPNIGIKPSMGRGESELKIMSKENKERPRGSGEEDSSVVYIATAENNKNLRFNGLKKILYWNDAYGNKDFNFGFGQKPFEEAGCKVSSCYATGNRSLFPLEEIDAVFWHLRAKDKSFPSKRTNIFRPLPQPSVRPTLNRAANKTKLAAWFVSHCRTVSEREILVKNLQLYVKVDIFGKCGDKKCPRKEAENCYEMVQRNYKFYLSFENSLCNEYITEKLYNIMRYDVVPVVYGLGYDNIDLPPHSYINVLDFSSIKSLADYLLFLDKNDTAYNEYFRWKTDYEQLNRKEVVREQFCRICEKLHEPILQTQSNTVPSSAQTRRLQYLAEKARSVKAANRIDLPKGRTDPQSIYVNGSQKIYKDLKDWFLIDECTKLSSDKQLSDFVHGNN